MAPETKQTNQMPCTVGRDWRGRHRLSRSRAQPSLRWDVCLLPTAAGRSRLRPPGSIVISQADNAVAKCFGGEKRWGRGRMNLGTLLPRHARCRADHIAIQFEDERYSFREVNLRVNKLANALHALGLRKGDKIATILPNCLEQLDVYWAAAKTGVVAVPMS